jgi:uncharacterized membrane protein
MALMAVDHVRDYLHWRGPAPFDPTDPDRTELALFLTRWLTHFCAPTFVFLAGLGAALKFSKGTPPAEQTGYLVSRGLWVLVLELIINRTFGWCWNLDFRFLPAWVLWVIGWSMISLGLMIRLPRWLMAMIAVTLIVGHNLTDAIQPEAFGAFAWLWRVLHTGGELTPWPGVTLSCGYPIIPWPGVMAAGFLAAPLVSGSGRERRRRLIVVGTLLTIAFLTLRGLNQYGDPNRWTSRPEPLRTVFAFLATSKYPPSLAYLLMTLGPALIVAGLLDRDSSAESKKDPAAGSDGSLDGERAPSAMLLRKRHLDGPLETIRGWLVILGRAPMLFYLLHLPLIHALAFALSWWRRGAWPSWLLSNPPLADFPPDFGVNVAGVWLISIGVIAVLLPICRRPPRWTRWLTG